MQLASWNCDDTQIVYIEKYEDRKTNLKVYNVDIKNQLDLYSEYEYNFTIKILINCNSDQTKRFSRD